MYVKGISLKTIPVALKLTNMLIVVKALVMALSTHLANVVMFSSGHWACKVH